MHYIIVFFIAIQVLSPLYAITPADLTKIQQQNAQILQNEKNRQAHQKNKNQSKVNIIDVEEENALPEASKEENCFIIDKSIFHNTKLLTQKDLDPIINRYKNRCLGATKIENLLIQINNLYTKRGYITSRAYIQAQNLSKKVLHIHIFEGKIEDITLNEKTKQSELTTAFPGLINHYLNLRDIEMGLDQLNRLPRNKATIGLHAGTKNGYSIINVTNEDKGMVSGQIATGNEGLDVVGIGQASGSLTLDNPLGYNMQFTLGANGSLEQNDEKTSRGYSWNFSLPYGYWLFSAGYREFIYRSTIYGNLQNYISSGIDQNYYGNMSYTFHRDTERILKVTAGLTFKQNLNFISNELLTTSSTKLTVGTIGLEATYTKNNTYLSASLLYHRGLPLFDHIDNYGHPYKRSLFSKVTANLHINHAFKFQEKDLKFISNITSQYSPHKLYTPELISMGGFYTVRGFNNMHYLGDIGVYAHNNINYPTTLNILGEKIEFTPHIGYDFGAIEYDSNIWKYMVGMGLGFNAAYKGVNFTYNIAIPLHAHDGVAEENYISSFNLVYKF